MIACVKKTDSDFLIQIANVLDGMPRQAPPADKPKAGMTIILSDSFARQLATCLRGIAGEAG
jgi:hypothetical protein